MQAAISTLSAQEDLFLANDGVVGEIKDPTSYDNLDPLAPLASPDAAHIRNALYTMTLMDNQRSESELKIVNINEQLVLDGYFLLSTRYDEQRLWTSTYHYLRNITDTTWEFTTNSSRASVFTMRKVFPIGNVLYLLSAGKYVFVDSLTEVFFPQPEGSLEYTSYANMQLLTEQEMIAQHEGQVLFSSFGSFQTETVIVPTALSLLTVSPIFPNNIYALRRLGNDFVVITSTSATQSTVARLPEMIRNNFWEVTWVAPGQGLLEVFRQNENLVAANDFRYELCVGNYQILEWPLGTSSNIFAYNQICTAIVRQTADETPCMVEPGAYKEGALFAQGETPSINNQSLFLHDREVSLAIELQDPGLQQGIVFKVVELQGNVQLSATEGLERWRLFASPPGDATSVTTYTLQNLDSGNFIVANNDGSLSMSASTQEGFGFALLEIPPINGTLELAFLLSADHLLATPDAVLAQAFGPAPGFTPQNVMLRAGDFGAKNGSNTLQRVEQWVASNPDANAQFEVMYLDVSSPMVEYVLSAPIEDVENPAPPLYRIQCCQGNYDFLGISNSAAVKVAALNTGLFAGSYVCLVQPPEQDNPSLQIRNELNALTLANYQRTQGELEVINANEEVIIGSYFLISSRKTSDGFIGSIRRYLYHISGSQWGFTSDVGLASVFQIKYVAPIGNALFLPAANKYVIASPDPNDYTVFDSPQGNARYIMKGPIVLRSEAQIQADNPNLRVGVNFGSFMVSDDALNSYPATVSFLSRIEGDENFAFAFHHGFDDKFVVLWSADEERPISERLPFMIDANSFDVTWVAPSQDLLEVFLNNDSSPATRKFRFKMCMGHYDVLEWPENASDNLKQYNSECTAIVTQTAQDTLWVGQQSKCEAFMNRQEGSDPDDYVYCEDPENVDSVACSCFNLPDVDPDKLKFMEPSRHVCASKKCQGIGSYRYKNMPTCEAFLCTQVVNGDGKEFLQESQQTCGIFSAGANSCKGNPCVNGQCIDRECACLVGFSGDMCETRNGVVCTRDNDCLNGGICRQGLCDCTRTPYTGLFCMEPMSAQANCSVDKDCGIHGFCENGKCRCMNGWGGEYCSIETFCSNDDQCPPGIDCIGGICQCPPGVTGPRCDIPSGGGGGGGDTGMLKRNALLGLWVTGGVFLIISFILAGLSSASNSMKLAAIGCGVVGLLFFVAGIAWYFLDEEISRF